MSNINDSKEIAEYVKAAMTKIGADDRVRTKIEYREDGWVVVSTGTLSACEGCRLEMKDVEGCKIHVVGCGDSASFNDYLGFARGTDQAKMGVYAVWQGVHYFIGEWLRAIIEDEG